MLRTFARIFTAADVSEPLRSFDEVRPTKEAAAIMARDGLQVAGVRRDGAVTGYMCLGRLGKASCGDVCATFKNDQIVPEDASLADVIEVLTRHDFCFVAPLGEITAVIQRSDMLKPVVRMWLFGILTLVEQEFTENIQSLWPGEEWRLLLSVSRLQMAEQLRAERVRREQPCSLLDCLQFSDKAQIVLHDPANLARLGLKSKGSAQRIIGDVESLRNNLAHSQDIVAHDWPQIVRIARRIETTASAFTNRDGEF
jgi:hypothetical protein